MQEKRERIWWKVAGRDTWDRYARIRLHGKSAGGRRLLVRVFGSRLFKRNIVWGNENRLKRDYRTISHAALSEVNFQQILFI